MDVKLNNCNRMLKYRNSKFNLFIFIFLKVKILGAFNGSLNSVPYVKVFWVVISHLFVLLHMCEIVAVPSLAYSVLDWVTNIPWINE
jgi:hypothetical protein